MIYFNVDLMGKFFQIFKYFKKNMYLNVFKGMIYYGN